MIKTLLTWTFVISFIVFILLCIFQPPVLLLEQITRITMSVVGILFSILSLLALIMPFNVAHGIFRPNYKKKFLERDE